MFPSAQENVFSQRCALGPVWLTPFSFLPTPPQSFRSRQFTLTANICHTSCCFCPLSFSERDLKISPCFSPSHKIPPPSFSRYHSDSVISCMFSPIFFLSFPPPENSPRIAIFYYTPLTSTPRSLPRQTPLSLRVFASRLDRIFRVRFPRFSSLLPARPGSFFFLRLILIFCLSPISPPSPHRFFPFCPLPLKTFPPISSCLPFFAMLVRPFLA